MRLTLFVIVIAQLLIAPGFAQDRPLFQPLRIGFPITGFFGDRLMADNTLDRGLRRIGLIASWHSFEDGLMALRALHAEEIDIALDISQHDAILARLDNLSMVFVAEASGRIPRRVDFADVNYWMPHPDFLPPAVSRTSRPGNR